MLRPPNDRRIILEKPVDGKRLYGDGGNGLKQKN